MNYFNKEKTYLSDFDKNAKRGYNKIGKIKPIFWFITYLISFLLMIVSELIFLIINFLVKHISTIISQGTKSFELIGIINDMAASPQGLPWFHLTDLMLFRGLMILSFLIYIILIEKRRFSTIGLKTNNKIKKYFKGALIAIAMQLIYFLMIIIFGWGEVLSKPLNATYAFGSSAIGMVLLFLIGFIIQGASEEVAVRGWMLPVLSKHYKVGFSIVISSFFFGFLHIGNSNVNTLSMVNLILYGVFASLYALYDDGLWGVFAHHSIWNWFMGNVLGLPVSGMILGHSSITETQLTGPQWITGGAFGPEGGIIVTMIFLISCIILIKLLINKGILIPKNDSSKLNQTRMETI